MSRAPTGPEFSRLCPLKNARSGTSLQRGEAPSSSVVHPASEQVPPPGACRPLVHAAQTIGARCTRPRDTAPHGLLRTERTSNLARREL